MAASDLYIPGWDNSKGRKAGLNLRESEDDEYFLRASNKDAQIEVFTDDQIHAMLKDVNRPRARFHVPAILDQDGVGSCAWETVAQTIMTSRALSGQPFELLAPWYGYQYTNSRDNGSSIDGNLKVVMDRGLAPMRLHPRSRGWRAAPTDEAQREALRYRPLEIFDITNDREFKSALLQRFIVAYGRSGHAITAVELEDFDTICYANSWGNWGDNGFGHERLSRSVNYGYGCWAIRSTVDDDPAPWLDLSRPTRHPLYIEPYPVIAN